MFLDTIGILKEESMKNKLVAKALNPCILVEGIND